MATSDDLDFTYSLTDRIFRMSIGEQADFSGARYSGDYTIPLEEAQHRKHLYVASQLGVPPGGRVLDLGCGWGAMLAFFRGLGVSGVGVTLSRAQYRACRQHGLDVHLEDARCVTRESHGAFDGVLSLGAFEHFCSIEQWKAGKQDEIYRALFHNVADMLPVGGKFFLQTMVFGPNMIPFEQIDINAPRMSDAHIIALLQKMFPGSWLASGPEQVEQAAAARFRLVARESGRLDYIETIAQWQKRFGKKTLRKLMLYVTLLPRYIFSADFRHAFVSGISANTIAFERRLFDHYRFTFERIV